ncbi:MAG: amidohydrolase family protein [Burkholderiales bacterium]
MNRRNFNAAFLGLGATAIGPIAMSGCASPMPTERITGIDTHAHAFHRGLPFVANRRYTPDYDAPMEQYLAQLDANGLSHGVVIPISILGTNNDYTLECVARSKGRLRGVAVVDPEADIGKLDGLARGGIVGIRLNLIGKPVPDFNKGAWRELIVACNRLKWHVEVYDDARRLPESLAPLVAAGASVVVDHFGKPDPKLGVADPGFKYLLGLGNTRQVWVKLSAPYRSSTETAQAAAPLLLRAFGTDRLMWGSDWPHTGFEGKQHYADLLANLQVWVPDPAQRQVVLAQTAARLYRFQG